MHEKYNAGCFRFDKNVVVSDKFCCRGLGAVGVSPA